MTRILTQRMRAIFCVGWAALTVSTASVGSADAGLPTFGVADCPPASNIIEGTEGPDVLVGTPGRDCLLGYGGNDEIDGGSDDDVIAGGTGDDTLRGGLGADQIYGEEGDDVIDGGNGRDTIVGGDGHDIIDGGNGTDTIAGGEGNDVIHGSLGGDSVIGGGGIDACESGCEAPAPVACSTSSDCAAGQSCAAGACVACRANSECADGLVCNGAETCAPTLGCQAAPALPFGFDLGTSCAAGVGACAASGSMVCDGSGRSACTAVPGAPAAESCNGIDDDCDGIVDDGVLDSDGDGLCDARDECAFHPDLTRLPGDIITGTMFCESPDDSSATEIHELTSFPVRTLVGETQTDCKGRYTYVVPTGSELPEGPFDVNFFYDGRIRGPRGGSKGLRVMDDFDRPWGTAPEHFGFGRTSFARLTTAGSGRRQLDIDPIVLSTSECEIWRIGAQVVNDYLAVRRQSQVFGPLKFMRRAGTFGVGPFAPYDYVELSSDFLDVRADRGRRERTLFHESGHVFRDIADGDRAHWDGDDIDYRYGRLCHTGREITEEPYAFHEGWAQYWAQARYGARSHLVDLDPVGGVTTTLYCGGENGPDGVPLTADHRDWVENLVADRILELAACVADPTGDFEAADNLMLETLEANPGTIHSLYEFETALCAAGGCCAMTRTEPPPSCPPGYTLFADRCYAPDTTSIKRYR